MDGSMFKLSKGKPQKSVQESVDGIADSHDLKNNVYSDA